MKYLIAALAACALAQPAFAQGRTDAVYACPANNPQCPNGPFIEEGLNVYTASRLIEKNASDVRVFATVKGKMVRGCQGRNTDNNVLQTAVRDITKFLDETIFAMATGVKVRLEDKMKDLRCDFAVARFKVLVDGQEIDVPGAKMEQHDYDFDHYGFSIDAQLGKQYNGKTVTVRVATANKMAEETEREVYVESR